MILIVRLVRRTDHGEKDLFRLTRRNDRSHRFKTVVVSQGSASIIRSVGFESLAVNLLKPVSNLRVLSFGSGIVFCVICHRRHHYN